jgi:hypothetical protein
MVNALGLGAPFLRDDDGSRKDRVGGFLTFAGESAGAPLSLIKSTRNFAGWVLLALRSTT